MDGHIGLRQSTRVAIKNSLLEMAKPADAVEKSGKKRKKIETAKKVSGKRKQTATKQVGKKLVVEKVEPAVEGAEKDTDKDIFAAAEDIPMDASSTVEEVSMGDCTMKSASEPEISVKDAELPSEPVSDGNTAIVIEREEAKVAVKKVAGKRKKKAPKKANKKQNNVKSKPEKIQQVDINANVPLNVSDVSMNDIVVVENVSMKECAMEDAEAVENTQKAAESSSRAAIKAILDRMMETFKADLAVFVDEDEEADDSVIDLREDSSDIDSESYSESIKAQLASLVTPFPQKLRPLIKPAEEPVVKLTPVRGYKKLKICSWFVDDPLSACVIDYITNNDWDIFCLQGLTWSHESVVPNEFKKIIQPYHCQWHHEETGFCLLVMSRIVPEHRLLNESFTKHSVMTLAFEDFTLVSAVAPSAGFGLAKFGEKLEWLDRLMEHLELLSAPVIMAGSLGIAREDIGEFNHSIQAFC